MNGAPTICPTVLRGFSDEYGSWKIICISRRSGRSERCEMREMSLPSKRIVPLVGSRRRSISLRGRRLAAARLADDAERLAAADGQRDVLDGVHLGLPAREHALPDLEVLRQVLELDEVVARLGSAHATSPSRPTPRAEPSSTFFSHARWHASRWASGIGATSGGSFVAHGAKR